MAFVPFSYDDGQPVPFEYYKLSAAGNIAIGTAMALSSGKLVASVTPEYICMRTESSAAADTVVPVIHISEDVVFEAPLAAASASLSAGSKVDVASGGLTIANTSTNGNVLIVDIRRGRAMSSSSPTPGRPAITPAWSMRRTAAMCTTTRETAAIWRAKIPGR